MKIIISILLVSSLLLQNLSKLVIILEYQINKEYIAKNLCVNRDKPKSCCEGKCQLQKRIDEDDKKTNETSNTLKDKYEKEQYCQSTTKFHFFTNKRKLNCLYNFNTGIGINRKIFHPPCCS